VDWSGYTNIDEIIGMAVEISAAAAPGNAMPMAADHYRRRRV
jgi:hypothetical protein